MPVSKWNVMEGRVGEGVYFVSVLVNNGKKIKNKIENLTFASQEPKYGKRDQFHL